MGISQSTIKWYQVERALVAARSDLRSIYAKVCFAEIGKLPEGIVREDLDAELKLEQGEVSEQELFFDGLLGIYGGLNYAWTIRSFNLNMAESVDGISFQVSTPTDGAFAALVPGMVQKRGNVFEIGNRPISLAPVRIALQAAFEKLTRLCYHISLLPGVQSPEMIEQPKGFDVSVTSQSFDEEDLELDLAMVYAHLNEAWNSRFNKALASDAEQKRKHREYPREVLG